MLKLLCVFLAQLKHPVDLNFQDDRGRCALHWAVEGSDEPEKRLKVVQTLLGWRSSFANKSKTAKASRKRSSSMTPYARLDGGGGGGGGGGGKGKGKTNLGPPKPGQGVVYLPPHWEARFDQGRGLMYFINHSDESTSWLDPRPLPEGWKELKNTPNGDVFIHTETNHIATYDPRGAPVTHPDSVDEVLNVYRNAHVDAVDSQGNSVLHLAAQQGLAKVVDLLVAGGGNLTRTNSSNRTPAEEADEAGHVQLASTMEARMVFGTCSCAYIYIYMGVFVFVILM
jgi:hypothetical protein